MSIGIVCLFFAYTLFEFGKIANSTKECTKIYYPCSVSTCLATIGVCVFGALTSVGALFYFCGKGIVEMAKKKCDYCGRYYEEEHEGTLDNGCPACPHCVAEEEIKEEKTKNKLRIVE